MSSPSVNIEGLVVPVPFVRLGSTSKGLKKPPLLRTTSAKLPGTFTSSKLGTDGGGLFDIYYHKLKIPRLRPSTEPRLRPAQ